MKPIVLSLLIITTLFYGSAAAQDQVGNDDGITITVKGDVTLFYDEFTGEYAIAVLDSTLLSSMGNDHEEKRKSYIIPFFGGDIYNENLSESVWTERWSDGFNIVLIREEPESYFFEEVGRKQIPFLIDGKRLSKSANYLKGSDIEVIQIAFNSSEWENIIQSEDSRYRISGQVFTIDQNSKSLMEQILSEHLRIQSEKDERSKAAERQRPARSAPYNMQWDGDLHRMPMVQPMPVNRTNQEATIRVLVEVNPDGSIESVRPLVRLNPELEREVMQTLQSWRFSRLPSNVPQEVQTGTITFRFVSD